MVSDWSYKFIGIWRKKKVPEKFCRLVYVVLCVCMHACVRVCLLCFLFKESLTSCETGETDEECYYIVTVLTCFKQKIMVPSPKQLENTLDELGTSIFSVMLWLMEELPYSFFFPLRHLVCLCSKHLHWQIAQEAAILLLYISFVRRALYNQKSETCSKSWTYYTH